MSQNVLSRPAAPAVAEPGSYKWKVLLVAAFGVFVSIMDSTVVNVALPELQKVFKADVSDVQWVISGYALALGIMTPLAGFLSDALGIRRVYLSSLVAFMIGSMLVGVAPSLPFMIVARVLQGLGGGALAPLGLALLLRTFPPAQRGMAFGVFGIPLIMAPALGPIVSGYFVEYSDWRWIFYINVPICLLGLVLGLWWVKADPARKALRVDYAGILFSTIGFGTILYALSEGARRGWASSLILGLLAVGLTALALFAVVELRGPAPIVNLRLFRNPIFLLGSIVGWTSVIGLFGAEFLMPLYLQTVRGQKPLDTGLLLLPLALTSGLIAPFAGRLLDRIGGRPLLIAGFSLLIFNTWQLTQITAVTDLGWIAFLLAVRGAALGMIVQTTLSTTLSMIRPAEAPRATSLANASRQVFQALGVAVLATIIQSHFVVGPRGPEMSTLLSGFEQAYQVTFWVSVLSLGLSLFLPGWPGRVTNPAAVAEPGAAEPAAGRPAVGRPPVPQISAD